MGVSTTASRAGLRRVRRCPGPPLPGGLASSLTSVLPLGPSGLATLGVGREGAEGESTPNPVAALEVLSA